LAAINFQCDIKSKNDPQLHKSSKSYVVDIQILRKALQVGSEQKYLNLQDNEIISSTSSKR